MTKGWEEKKNTITLQQTAHGANLENMLATKECDLTLPK